MRPAFRALRPSTLTPCSRALASPAVRRSIYLTPPVAATQPRPLSPRERHYPGPQPAFSIARIWTRGYASDDGQRKRTPEDGAVPRPNDSQRPSPTEERIRQVTADRDAQEQESKLKELHEEAVIQAEEQASLQQAHKGAQSPEQPAPPSPKDTTQPTPSHPSSPPPPTIPKDDINNHTLPSETASSRSTLIARFQTASEHLITRLTIASQQLNIYTGTDYSGISALRNSISKLESQMRQRHSSVETAKESHATALASQSTSQKEVVQLLERKHSWSAADLERYMTLIRSEHLNEQAVQSAKDAVAQAERDLEEARQKLEKYERRQYHEEQIWSDTIRRNSTWVTFGLMGFNIFLLLASLVVLEPWRRRRLVREVRAALDEKAEAGGAGGVAGPTTLMTDDEAAAATITPSEKIVSEKVARQVDEATPPGEESLEQAQEAVLAADPLQLPVDSHLGVETTLASASPQHVPISPLTLIPEPEPEPPSFTLYAETWTRTFELWRIYWADLFSERLMRMRRRDLTAAALEGAVAGAACMGMLFVLLRPR